MTLRIAEIFGPTIQGEGALIGEPTVFVRAGGCDYRCSWCDSLHAVESQYRHSWAPMETDAVWAKVHKLSGGQPLTVSLSGGNPAIQDFGPLITKGRAAGYRFACETQGSIPGRGSPNLTRWSCRPSRHQAARTWIGMPSTAAAPSVLARDSRS